MPLKFTMEPLTKFVPFTVNVNAPEPASVFVGDTVVMVGTGLFATVIAKLTAFEVPPTGAGFATVTGGVPTAVTSPARTCAVNFVALTNVVVLALSLKFTTDVVTKFVPFTVNVKAPEPAVALFGCNVVIVGTGLFTVKMAEFDVPPPGAGLVTVTPGVPAVLMSLARMEAVNCVALTKVVARALPLKLTTDEFMKFVPITVSVKPPLPVNANAGCNVVTVGTG